nr:pectinesterase family protein [uncultured Roseateles sp.]
MRYWLLTLAAVAALAHAEPRPQLGAEAAAGHQVADYLAQGGAPWLPAPLGDGSGWTPDFIVAADGSGTHKTVQAALDAVPAAAASTKRHHILVRPGSYREQLCVQGKAPITLYGGTANPAATVIVQGHYNAEPKRAGLDSANPCYPDLQAASHGTAGSASVAIFSDAFQLAHLTLANDAMDRVRDGVGYPACVGESGGAQAVALMTQGDRIQLENVRLLGHQDTFYVRAVPGVAPSRVYVHNSLIAGDVDFIFGNATLVIANSTVLSRAGRRAPGSGGHVLAPSTAADTRLGLLITGSRFVAEPGLSPGAISLGRAWDFGVARGAWVAGRSPNGQALVRDSLIGPHIGPWAASTSRRPFSDNGEAANRLSEFNNRPLSALASQVLGSSDGWAAADGGTTGGAAAQPQHHLEARNRAELVAALALGPSPKVISIRGRIDLSVDDAGKPLGYNDYRDPAFDLDAYLKAYDPATWGRKPPEGVLEQARVRSAQRQAARVVVPLPSNTTLIGLGADAQIVNGTLFLGKVDNIIVRNLHFSDAYDYFPGWDPKDGELGEWNSEYDNITLRGATHVWVDHCTFDDGPRPDQTEPVRFGRRVQHHDGLLDITKESNHVTVSWNQFRDHDKTNLVGSGDGQQLDAGKLRVTFHHNLWERTKARTPRVRYGEVHVYNNLFVGDKDAAYAYDYSLGVGFRSRIYSERNTWETSPQIGPGQLTKLWKGSAFFDSGSLHNGRPVNLLEALRAANPGAEVAGDVGWRPQLYGPLDEAGQVAAKVRAGAGAGRL